MTVLHYDKISERDIDMLVLAAFVSEKNFADIFVRKIPNIASDYTVCSAEVSKTDPTLGESDLLFHQLYRELFMRRINVRTPF